MIVNLFSVIVIERFKFYDLNMKGENLKRSIYLQYIFVILRYFFYCMSKTNFFMSKLPAVVNIPSKLKHSKISSLISLIS
jgi:hypothetical protein